MRNKQEVDKLIRETIKTVVNEIPKYVSAYIKEKIKTTKTKTK